MQAALTRCMAGRTTIVVAHRLSTVENADLIVVLNEGQVLEAGTHAELMSGGAGVHGGGEEAGGAHFSELVHPLRPRDLNFSRDIPDDIAEGSWYSTRVA